VIFKQEMVDAIMSGRKTVTRRPVKYDLCASGFGAPYARHQLRPCRYKVDGGPGGTYALQGPPEKGSKARAKTVEGYRLRVTRVNPEVIVAITDDEARLEGFRDRRAFFAYWKKLYRRQPDPTQIVHRIEFELVASVDELGGNR
jgi:hypothetical protein